jgi:hypothetical protein
MHTVHSPECKVKAVNREVLSGEAMTMVSVDLARMF